MKLEAVNIKRFRSIDDILMTDCGSFNVLIGKNNSGKSSILTAIQAFFTCIKSGSVASLHPPIGQDIDFFERDTRNPIEITFVFALALAERDALVRDIVTEAPQMKNAVDGIDPSLRLAVTLRIISAKESFSYITKVALTELVGSASKSVKERILFSVGIETAEEIRSQLLLIRRQTENAEGLLNISRYMSSEDLRRVTARTSAAERASSTLPTVMLREISRDIRPQIERMYRDANSIDDFLRDIKSLSAKIAEESKSILDEPLKYKVGTFSGDEEAVPTYITNILVKISEMKVLYLTERRKEIGKEEAERILALKTVRGQERILKNLKDTVSSLLGVQIDAFQSQVPLASGQRTAELDVDNFLVEVNGSGVREALRLILDYEFEHPDILLVEEPETHLHPALETSMMRYLKQVSNVCQVFITTHSTNFLDTAEMKNVYLISKDRFTQVQVLNLADAETHIPRELGIRLSSLFMFDRLVFVEGASDEDIIREWATTLNVNLGQANVGFIPMGGVRNFAHFAAEQTLSFLTRRQVQIWFVIDKDERDDADIAKMQHLLQGKASIHALPKREIENYMIVPRAITEFLQFKRQLSGNTNTSGLPSEEEIIKDIEEYTEQLKQFTIDKRVTKAIFRPIYPSMKRLFDKSSHTAASDRISSELERMRVELDSMQNSIAEAYEQHEGAIDTIWHREKLSLVPGDMLLDMICQKYGTRFVKERDGARLAALMRPDEIGRDIQVIINNIGSSQSS
jgi:putative ATP-dependent endonuclease of the OLD family